MTGVTSVTIPKSSKAFEEAVSLTNYGKFNLYVILATGGALACVIIESMSAMFIIPASQCDLNLSLSDKGLLYSINFFGVVSSSYPWGYIADTRGRKIVVLISLFVSAILTIICSFITLPWLFILLRYANGFFVGGSSAITYAYAGEFHDGSRRANVVAWIASSVAWGAFFIPGIAWLIIPQQWSFEISFLDVLYRPWRLLMLIYALPSIIFGIMVLFLPESPKYLLMEGKNDEVLEILQKMYASNTGNDKEDYPVSDVYWDEEVIENKKQLGFLKSLWMQTRPLFTREHFYKTILVCYLQFAIFFSNNSVMMWYPDILNSMSAYGKTVPLDEITMCTSLTYEETITNTTLTLPRMLSSNPKICTDTIEDDAFLMPLIIGACYVCVYIPIATIINKVGPRNLMYGFMTVTAIGGICAQLLSGYTFIQVTLGIFLMNGPCISIVNAINVDLYPTKIRGMALAISLMFGRIGAMTGSNVIGPMISEFCDYTFYIFAIIHASVILVIFILPKYKALTETITEEKELT